MIYKDAAQDLNENAIKALENISLLEDNWDGEDAMAQPKDVIAKVSELIFKLGAVGQEIFNVVPGFDGEIVIYLRNGNKTMEILFYPNKSKYVTLDASNNDAQQGVYDDGTLT